MVHLAQVCVYRLVGFDEQELIPMRSLSRCEHYPLGLVQPVCDELNEYLGCWQDSDLSLALHRGKPFSALEVVLPV